MIDFNERREQQLAADFTNSAHTAFSNPMVALADEVNGRLFALYGLNELANVCEYTNRIEALRVAYVGSRYEFDWFGVRYVSPTPFELVQLSEIMTDAYPAP